MSIVATRLARRDAPLLDAGIPEEQRGVDGLVVPRHDALAPPPVLAQQEAVVGVDDQHRVVPHVVLVHEVQDATERAVAHRDEREVLGADGVDGRVRLDDAPVGGPVVDPLVVPVRIQLAVPLVAEEGLVRVERLDLQEPVLLRRRWSR